jgi:hypothetical protein
MAARHFRLRRTLVPIRRVQHVDTESGLSLQGGCTPRVESVHTAAGATAIPALTRADAERVRARVSVLPERAIRLSAGGLHPARDRRRGADPSGGFALP